MFFYVSLIIACAVVAVFVLYLYNALAVVSKSAFRAFLPSKKDNLASNIKNVKFNSTTVKDTQTPWGWKGNGNNIREHGRKKPVVNGTSGLNAYLDNKGHESSNVGWPYREEKTELAGKAYKVTRKSSSQKSRLRTTGSQPWGW